MSPGNLLCVWAFNKKDVELKPSFANLLKCLSIFDTIFLVCVVAQFSLPRLSELYLLWVLPYLTPYTLVLLHFSLTGSVYTVGHLKHLKHVKYLEHFGQIQIDPSGTFQIMRF